MENKGITQTLFVIGLILAILIASAISYGLSTQVSVGTPGPKGDKGDAGPQGPAGAAGSPGSPGATGATGTTGAVGQQGLKGDTGATGAIGATGATGPQGAPGAAGPQGPKGLTNPDYDSGWIDITNKAGQYFDVSHNLNTPDIITQITGKTTSTSQPHQRYYGITGYIPGWNKTYGGPGAENGQSGIQTSDGGYALIGYTNASGPGTFGSVGGNNDIWLLKTNSEGAVQWSKTYGGPDDDRGYFVMQTKDGGFAIAGGNKFGSSRTSNNDVSFIKTDAAGNAQWNKTYGLSNAYEWGYYIVETKDGGYAIEAATINMTTGVDSFFLIKTDSAGNMQWSKTYAGLMGGRGFQLVQTVEGGYAIGGVLAENTTTTADFAIVKTDSNGNMQWNRTYGGSGIDIARGLIVTRDGGYALAGFSTSFGSGDYDIWLIKTDANGIAQWNKTYGGPKDDKILWYGLIETNDGYAMAGYTQSFGAGGANVPVTSRPADYPPTTDAWLIKIDVYGNVQWTKTIGGADDEYAATLIKTSDGGLAIAGSKLSVSSNNWDMWLAKIGFDGEAGLALTDSTANTLTLYRGANDFYWNFVRVQVWKTR